MKSSTFNSKFTFTPAKLAKGATPSDMTGTYYSNAKAVTFDASSWYSNVAINTGVKCTFTADPKANGNISFQQLGSIFTFTVKNQQTAFAKTTANQLSCVSDQQTTAVNQTFSYTWNGCATASLKSSVNAGNGAAYPRFQGVKGQATYEYPDISTLFFVNQNCPSTSDVQGVQGVQAATPAATSDCQPTTKNITAQSLSVITTKPPITSAAVSLISGVKYGYSTQITISCTPKGATAAMSSQTTVSQTCYQVLTKAANTDNIVLARSTTAGAVQQVFKNPVQNLFSGYDSNCAIQSVASVTTDKSYCVVAARTATNPYAISCQLTGNYGGYSGPVTVTVNQAGGNAAVTSTFMVSLPSGTDPNPPSPPGPAPTPTKSKTTAIVLGVIGGIVGLGIVIGVAWYVIKGRQDADVDPYEEDATTGLTAQQDA